MFIEGRGQGGDRAPHDNIIYQRRISPNTNTLHAGVSTGPCPAGTHSSEGESLPAMMTDVVMPQKRPCSTTPRLLDTGQRRVAPLDRAA